MANVDDPAFNAGYTVLFSLLAQEPRIGRRIDMVGIAQRILLQQTEPACFRGHQLRGVAAILFGKAERPGFEPEGLEACRPATLTCEAEGMNIVMADSPPVFELDGQLEGSLHPGQKFCFINIQQAMHGSERRYGCLADTNRTYGIRFHEDHVQVGADQLRDGGRRSPARGTAAHDDYILYLR